MAYSLFDFGNSSFSLIYHAYLFPLFFKNALLAGSSKGDLLWGALLSGSALTAAIIAPFLGRLADRRGRWGIFALSAVFSFAATVALALGIGTGISTVCILFFLASFGFYAASTIYDSLLKVLVEEKSRTTFSSFAWGFGYLGGVLCFVGVFLLQRAFGLESVWPYLFAAIFYAVFGVWSIFWLKRFVSKTTTTLSITWRGMLAQLNRPRIILLVGYFLIADCISAVIAFTSIYASDQLKLSTESIGGFLLSVQLLGFPLTWFMGRAAQRFGSTRVLTLCVCVWSLILGAFILRVDLVGMIVVCLLTALVIGSTQAIMRAQYSQFVEEERTAELFGWYGVVTESSSIFAPLLFGMTSFVSGSQRFAMGLLLIPLVLGIVLIRSGVKLFKTRAN